MTRGRTKRGRERASRALLEVPSSRPLLRAVDHGPAIRLEGKSIGAVGDRWIEPFLDANRAHLKRLDIRADIEVRDGLGVRLTPGARIGAVPLLSPSTRRVAAGLLVSPRFQWSSLGAVLGATGFATEPTVGGTPLVPGSAREVPAWLLAAPVIRRLEAFLQRRKRGFYEREEERLSPRGQVRWSRWATRHVPSGRWTSLPCRFSEPDDDPELLASIRWTLQRLDDELASYQEAAVARALLGRIADLRFRVGEGPARRPSGDARPHGDGWTLEAMQAMGWVAEHRGLGGSRILDGMSWDLPIDEVWEAWVEAFVAELAPRCGLRVIPRGDTTRRLNWSTRTSSMRFLLPDTGLRGANRVIWVDAKYKAHLQLLARKGWAGLDELTRDAHRADLHQALAYAALDDVEHVDSLLVYPELSPDDTGRAAIATVASGRRRVRLMLVGLPFGFTGARQREQALEAWRGVLGLSAV